MGIMKNRIAKTLNSVIPVKFKEKLLKNNKNVAKDVVIVKTVKMNQNHLKYLVAASQLNN